MSDNQQNSSINAPNINDLVAKLINGNKLEQEGKTSKAIAVYLEILELDRGGNYGNVAQQALDNLGYISSEEQSSEATIFHDQKPDNKDKVNRKNQSEFLEISGSNLPNFLNFFANLPIRRKQFTTVIATQLFSVLGVVGVGALLIISTGKKQLLEQAKAELAVANINYNIKIDQMGYGFQGKASNAVLVDTTLANKFNAVTKLDLIKETWTRQIEFATLVNAEGKIIVSANLDRYGKEFNPQGLVSEAIANATQIKSTEFISYQDIVAESPRLGQIILEETGQKASNDTNFLIRYTVTPITTLSGLKIGALVSGDIVKNTIATNTLKTFNGGYSGIYQVESGGTFKPAVSQVQDKTGTIKPESMSDTSLLQKAAENKGAIVSGVTKIKGKTYSLAAQALSNYAGEPVAVLVRGTPQDTLNSLILSSLTIQGAVLLVIIGISGVIASYLGGAIAKPIEQLQAMAQNFASGNREIRAKVSSKDEVGELTNTFNRMADSIVVSEKQLLRISEEQEAEANKQRQAREKLQQEVVNLLLEIEGAQRGDLTVKAKITDGAVGSIADAFNSTINKLRELVLQVQTVSNDVNELSQNSETSVSQLSQKAIAQVEEINATLNKIAEINQSIQNVDNSTQKAAKIARLARNKAKRGDETMNRTVDSIEKIRTTVAGTTKKVKQLAESSQEIAQIVEIISGISEKTNLLAFNASIEASRAGEHGEGFKIVAEEVRGLADRVTEATKDIQQLVTNIQKETAEVLQAMEVGNSEVVTGTDLVRKTKLTLQSLAATSEQIDQQLQFISSSTTQQTQSSQEVNFKMADVAQITENTSTEAQEVAESLQTLVKEAEILKLSVSQFRVKAEA